MGTDFAPPYACLTMGFLEETQLEPKLRHHFTPAECKLIIDHFFRYIDDGFSLWLKSINLATFMEIMNSLHPSIKFTFELGQSFTLDNGEVVLVLNFLDIRIILHPDGRIETDIYYKETNTHDYLPYNSHHPEHVKNNIPYTLAKKIIVFCSSRFLQTRLSELRTSLLKCGYPPHIINRGFHNAKLQGPAPDPSLKKKALPLVSTFNSNLDSKKVISTSKELLSQVKDKRLKGVFGNHTPILALKQPPNILRQLTSAKFSSAVSVPPESGLFRCSDNKCRLCRFYIQQCSSFTVANGTEWTIKSHITCQSKCVVYYLVCVFCNGDVSKTGKTNIFRKRMNNHISDCRSGDTSDKFDIHVHQCMKKHKKYDPPFFKIYVYLEVSHPKYLIPYEDHLHTKNFDTISKRKV